jgi:hypothetical protein
MRLARWAFAVLIMTRLLAPLGAGSAFAQPPQDDSLAAAARRAQDKKAQQGDSTKTPKVWDNDNIPTTGGAISVIGPSGNSADSSAAPAAATDATVAAPSADELAVMQAALDSTKSQLANLKADLDIMQRKYVLDQATYYGTTGYASDRAATAALAGEKSNIDAKQAAVAAAEAQLAAAQSKFDAANKAAATQAAADKAAAAQAAAQAAANPPQPAPQQPAPATNPADRPNPEQSNPN